MAENIFEGANFGDKFLTRGNKRGHGIAIYHYYDSGKHRHYLISKGYHGYLAYRDDGTCSLDTSCAFMHDVISCYQEFDDESSDTPEEIVINNQLDKPCQLYKAEKMIGTIYNSTALNDVLAQLYLKEKEGIDVSDYYIMFEGQKLTRSKHTGRLVRVPDNFFNTDKENLAILFQLG